MRLPLDFRAGATPMEESKNYLDIINELLAERDDEGTREYLSTLHPSDIASVFEELSEEDMAFPL